MQIALTSAVPFCNRTAILQWCLQSFAGVGVMPYKRFSLYNVGGAVLWSVLFVGGGFLLGNIPAVKHNFSIVVFAIVGFHALSLSHAA